MYAIVGMEVFQGKVVDYGTTNFSSLTTMQRLCGNTRLNESEFSRLYYCEKNFNNIIKSYVVLFDLTVVNQWHGILFQSLLIFVKLVNNRPFPTNIFSDWVCPRKSF